MFNDHELVFVSKQPFPSYSPPVGPTLEKRALSDLVMKMGSRASSLVSDNPRSGGMPTGSKTSRG